MIMTTDKRLEKALKYIDDIRKLYEADLVKIYFESEKEYCVKIIKNGNVIQVFRKRDYGKLYADRSHR